MGKQYNTELQAKVETYMKETGISQAKLAQFPLVKDMNPLYQSTFPINR